MTRFNGFRLIFVVCLLCVKGLLAADVPKEGMGYVLAVEYNSSWYALRAQSSKNGLGSVEITLTDDKTRVVSLPYASIVWRLEASVSGSFHLKSADKYVGVADGGLNLVLSESVNETSSNKKFSWAFTQLQDGTYTIASVTTASSRFLGFNPYDGFYFKNYAQTDYKFPFRLFPVYETNLDDKSMVFLDGVNEWTAKGIANLKLLSGVTSVDFRKITIPPEIVLPDDANPNCLFYVNEGDKLPSVFTNVVQVAPTGEAVAEQLMLTDEADFCNRLPFRVIGRASYERYLYEGWSTIALPFEYVLQGELCERFQAVSGSDLTFVKVEDKLLANHPYLIHLLADAQTAFVSENVYVPATQVPVSPFRSNFLTFIMPKDKKLYKLNSEGTHFVHSAGNATIGPFRAYLNLNEVSTIADVFNIQHHSDESTSLSNKPLMFSLQSGCLSVRAAATQTITIYNLSGQPVWKQVVEPGWHTYALPLFGVYVLNGQKLYFNR